MSYITVPLNQTAANFNLLGMQTPVCIEFPSFSRGSRFAQQHDNIKCLARRQAESIHGMPAILPINRGLIELVLSFQTYLTYYQNYRAFLKIV